MHSSIIAAAHCYKYTQVIEFQQNDEQLFRLRACYRFDINKDKTQFRAARCNVLIKLCSINIVFTESHTTEKTLLIFGWLNVCYLNGKQTLKFNSEIISAQRQNINIEK